MIQLYDTTLRDGAQFQAINLSVTDKLAITRKLDQLGIHYIEGGWPGSNPTDAEFFSRAKNLELTHSIMVAFGSTRKANVNVSEDTNIRALVDAGTSTVTLVGKSWDLHVKEILETSLEENLAMIFDSVSYLKSKGIKVFFDAEHYFDGFKANQEYALQVVKVAASAGAETVILCDTNGGSLPVYISEVFKKTADDVTIPLGIHTHNDSDTAVAGAIAAIGLGASQVQGTINGYGERCGNANLISIIANLKLKLGIDCVTDDQLKSLKEVSRYVAQITNMPPYPSQPFVGDSAFTHKGGIHVQAVSKIEDSYQHITPNTVGNEKTIVVSELSGRSNLRYKIEELGLNINMDRVDLKELLQSVKMQESRGFQFEGADASFELMIRRAQADYVPAFQLVDFTALVEARGREDLGDHMKAQVMLKVNVDGEIMQTAADGNGPVNALDNALRKALLGFYPILSAFTLVDYKVRVVDLGKGTEAIVRVFIDSTDGENTWTTVGASENIIEASWMALADSYEFGLLNNRRYTI